MHSIDFIEVFFDSKIETEKTGLESMICILIEFRENKAISVRIHLLRDIILGKSSPAVHLGYRCFHIQSPDDLFRPPHLQW